MSNSRQIVYYPPESFWDGVCERPMPAPEDWICRHLDCIHPEYRMAYYRDLKSWYGDATEDEIYDQLYAPPTNIFGNGCTYPSEGSYRDFMGRMRRKPPFDPQQPYIVRGGSTILPFVRPLDLFNFQLGPGTGKQKIDAIYQDAILAIENKPCNHQHPTRCIFGYRVGYSPIFFPCEARQLFGVDRGNHILERIIQDVAALKQLSDGLWAYVLQYSFPGFDAEYYLGIEEGGFWGAEIASDDPSTDKATQPART